MSPDSRPESGADRKWNGGDTFLSGVKSHRARDQSETISSELGIKLEPNPSETQIDSPEQV